MQEIFYRINDRVTVFAKVIHATSYKTDIQGVREINDILLTSSGTVERTNIYWI